MAVPTYGGAAIFGVAASFTAQDTDPATQTTAFPGADGVVTTHLGNRGSFVIVRSLVVGATIDDFNAALGLLESFKDGLARPLVNWAGVTWRYALLRKIDYAQTPDRYDLAWGWHRAVTCTFFIPRP